MADGELSAQLARIARDVQARESLAGAGEEIVAATAALFDGGCEAAVSLAYQKRRVENGGASADWVRRADELQTELGEGPCLDAVWDHEQVYSGYLAADPRWPTWGPRIAEEHGVQSMLCSRLFTDGRNHVGALNIYSTEPYAFDQADRDLALALATHVAVAVASAQTIEGLKLANDRRTTIGKAIGFIMATYDLGDDRAFEVLSRLSSHSNRKLYDIAEDVIRTRGLPPPR